MSTTSRSAESTEQHAETEMTGEVDLFGEDVTAEMLESYVQKSSTTNMLSQSSCMAALSQIMLATGIDPEKASPAFEPALEMP